MTLPRIILCPGQGAQAVGMAKAWYDASPEARATFDHADRILGARLGAKLSELCFNGPVERLHQTDVSQPALYVAGVASWHALLASWNAGSLEESGLCAAAGLSLGEYTALHIAGAFSFADGLELVTLRGRAMQDAATAVPSGMVALIGADEAQARQVCAEAAQSDVLVVANLNAPGQVVVSGSKSACERALPVAEKLGIKATTLAVAGAFHSPIMAPAAERLRTALAKATIVEPRAVVVSNVTAQPHEAAPGSSIAATIRQRLVDQLTAPVRWSDSCLWLSQAIWGSGTLAAGQPGGGAEFHELAPGKTLMGLMRRIEKSIKVHTHDAPNA